jgi:hypothetical protein
MILKRHRDYSFTNRKEERPISVIITTLAAHSYNGEETIGRAPYTAELGRERPEISLQLPPELWRFSIP